MSVFGFEELDGQIGLLTIDTPDKKVNTLGRVILEELSGIVDGLEKRDDLQAVMAAVKEGGFETPFQFNRQC